MPHWVYTGSPTYRNRSGPVKTRLHRNLLPALPHSLASLRLTRCYVVQSARYKMPSTHLRTKHRTLTARRPYVHETTLTAAKTLLIYADAASMGPGACFCARSAEPVQVQQIRGALRILRGAALMASNICCYLVTRQGGITAIQQDRNYSTAWRVLAPK